MNKQWLVGVFDTFTPEAEVSRTLPVVYPEFVVQGVYR